MPTMHEFVMDNMTAAIAGPEAVMVDADPVVSVNLLKDMHATLSRDRVDFDRAKDYFDGEQTVPYAPRQKGDELIDLQKRSVLNLIPELVGWPASMLYIDGYRRPVDDTDGVVALKEARFTPEYEAWQKCRMDSRQVTIWEAALKYGPAYTYTYKDPLTEQTRVDILPTRHTVAYFRDPVNDIRPVIALTIKRHPRVVDGKVTERGLMWAITAKGRTEVWFDTDGEFFIGAFFPEERSECPVIRYTCKIDDEGNVEGVVLPAVVPQDRLNQQVFNTNVNSQYGSFKVRTIAGMEPPPKRDPQTGRIMMDPEGNIIPDEVLASNSRMLLADQPDVKFGTLDATPMEGFITTEEQAIKNFAVKGKLPAFSLLGGNIANVGVEALEALEVQFWRWVGKLQQSFGESAEEQFRLLAEVEGDTAGAEAFGGEVRWRDMKTRSTATLMDGIAKLAAGQQVPMRWIIRLLPGLTSGDLADLDAEIQEQQDQFALDASMMPEQTAEAESVSRPFPTPLEAFGNGDNT